MSLISNLIFTPIINKLEKQFVSLLPELQQEFLNEISTLNKMISDWFESKLNIQGAPKNEEKGS